MLRSLLALTIIFLIYTTPIFAGQIDITYISPKPYTSNLRTTESVIIYANQSIDASSLNNSLITLQGTVSGAHTGQMFLAKDGKTVIFKPTDPFRYEETVSLQLAAGIKTTSGDTLKPMSYTFEIRREYIPSDFVKYNTLETRIPFNNYEYKIISDFTLDNPAADVPEITVLNYTNPSYGRVFLSPFRFDAQPFTPYLMISENSGEVFYSNALGSSGLDFKKLPNGNIVYYEDLKVKYYMMDTSYTIVDSFECGNGYYTDLHEIKMLDNGNVYLMSYDSTIIDMSQIVQGGDSNALVVGLVIQEVDTDKNVIFQWRSWDNMEITDASHQNLTAPVIDYIHGNSIEEDYDGNIIISSRHFDEITKINRTTGENIWRLGGKKNEFIFINDDIMFTYQHDARKISSNRLTLFDNGNFHTPPFSRAVEYELDEVNKTATLVWDFDHDKEIFGFAMGNAQRLSNGNTLIGWGAANPNITEVNALGGIVHEMTLPQGYYSYRAVKFPFKQSETAPLPENYSLNQNYPNPFNPITLINFDIPVNTNVSLKVYDVTGREIAKLVNGNLVAGTHFIQWNPGNIASGVYFYTLVAGDFVDTKKMVFIK